MHHQIKIFLLALILSANTATAQEVEEKELSLSEAIEKTVANNRQLKSAQLDYQSAESDVDQIKSYRLPQIDASVTGSVTNLPLNSFGSALNHGAIEQSDFIPASLNDPAAITNLQSKVLFQQPLMNLDIRSMKEAMVAKKEAFEQKVVRTEEVLKSHVAQTFLQLQLTHEVMTVLEKAKATALANLKLTQDNIDAGYLQKVDRLSVELRITEIENQIFEAKSNIQYASDQLSFLMGESMTSLYIPQEQLLDIDQSQILLEELPADRSDFKAMNFQIEAQNHQLKSAKKTNLPRINAFGSYELNNPLDFQDAQHGYLFGLQTSWKIFDGLKNKNSVQKSKIQIEKSQTDLQHLIAQNNMELQHAKRKMIEARNRINLTKNAIDQSKEALRIKLNRYEESIKKTTDILFAETNVSQQEMNHIQAIYQYQLAYTQINMLLEQNQ